MPLVTCPDCRGEISDAAPACVHCGRPNPRVPRSAAKPGLPLRATGRFAAAMTVIVVALARWRYGGRSEGLDLVLSALMPLALGAYLLLREVPETPATPGTRRRGGVSVWSAGEDARREFRWSTLLGGVLVTIGTLTLLLSILAM